MYKVAVINPISQSDYLANTVLDGLITLQTEGELIFRSTSKYPNPFNVDEYMLSDIDFMNFAREADLIILVWGKKSTNFKLAEKIGLWDKTVFVDGSEFGKNNRFDPLIQKGVLDGSYDGQGSVDRSILTRCRLYFRREKPYINGIVPFPFGIESRYREYFNEGIKKDIDFVCIFGQDEYPLSRRYAREILVDFCKKNNLNCVTKRTDGFNFDDTTKKAGRDEFYKLLARAKVGISIGGGGFDTARFWEILGNNCILLTEKIDIYNRPKNKPSYSRIHEFNNLFDFGEKLELLRDHLRTSYNQDILLEEYNEIIKNESSKARVMYLIEQFKSIKK